MNRHEHTLLLRGVSDSGLAIASIEDNGQRAKKGVAVSIESGDQYFLSDLRHGKEPPHLPSAVDCGEQVADRSTQDRTPERGSEPSCRVRRAMKRNLHEQCGLTGAPAAIMHQGLLCGKAKPAKAEL